MILTQKNINHFYQVFIEPKGEQFSDSQGTFIDRKEGWKEQFLLDIFAKYGGEKTLKAENNEYKLIGLPLYNQKNSKKFREEIEKRLLIVT